MIGHSPNQGGEEQGERRKTVTYFWGKRERAQRCGDRKVTKRKSVENEKGSARSEGRGPYCGGVRAWHPWGE